MEGSKYNKSYCEFLRIQAKQQFDKVRGTWVDIGRWCAPWRIKWMLSQTEGERNNYHIVDDTHLIAKRSANAGFLEGNTSAGRPWYRIGTGDTDLDMSPKVHEWLDIYTRRTLKLLTSSNFYDAAALFYDDYNTFNTGAHYIDEIDGSLFFHNLIPGSYYVINNSYGEATTLIREFSLNVKALVDLYGRKRDGMPDWSNFSTTVRKAYEDGNYTQMIDIVHIVTENDKFDPNQPVALMNKQWLSKTYEIGRNMEHYFQDSQNGSGSIDPYDPERYLNVSASKRKPFIIGKSVSNGNFEYGEKGPSLDGLGLIKSLNKKAIDLFSLESGTTVPQI